MVRSLTIIPDVHYVAKGSFMERDLMQVASKARVEDGFLELYRNIAGSSHWSDLEIDGIKNRKFGVVYPEGVYSDMGAAELESYLKRIDPDELDGENFRDRYIQSLVLGGAKIRRAENAFWFKLHGFCVRFGPLNRRVRTKLIDKRDYWIARNIAGTLADGEEAMLIVGRAHSPEKYLQQLAPDIHLDLRYKKPE